MITIEERLRIRLRGLQLLIRWHFKDQFDAIQVMRWYNKNFKHSVDWHEFSDMLSELNVIDILEHIGHTRDGMTIYRFSKEILNDQNSGT